jgi:hypothetical protein
MREAVIEALERAIRMPPMALDIKQAQVEVSRQEYLKKLQAHTSCMK